MRSGLSGVLLVALGGAVGSVARFGLSSLVGTTAAGARFPLGTLVVNVLGCAAIGAFMGSAYSRDWLLGPARLFVVTGLLGGFTTFSAFGWETYALAEGRSPGGAALNVLLQLALGIGAVWLGARLAVAALAR